MWKYFAAVAVVFAIIIIALAVYSKQKSADKKDSDGGQTGSGQTSGGQTSGGQTSGGQAGGNQTAPADPNEGTPFNDPLDSFTMTEGTALPGNNSEIYSGLDSPQECAKKCLAYAGCRSFDYRVKTDKVGSACHISTKTKDDTPLYSSYPGWNYYHLNST